MPIDNPIIINYNITNNNYNGGGGGDNGITLAANYYQIPVDVTVVVAEFNIDLPYTKIEIYGQAQVYSAGQQLYLHIIKDNVETSLVHANISALTPTAFTLTLDPAESPGNYQFIAHAIGIGYVGDAKINYAILYKS